MSIVLEFGIIGIAAGALTALLAVGIVVTYRGSRVVNFAQGAVGMVGTYAFYYLHNTHHVVFVVSAVAGVAVSGLVGLTVERVVMRPMRRSPQVSRVIASLVVLTVLEQGMSHIVNPSPLFVPPSLPSGQFKFLGAPVQYSQLVIVGVVLVLLVALHVLYKYTQFGRATTASLDNPRALSALGFSPNTLSAANWALGGSLAGVAGILLAPTTGLAVSTYTLLVLPALAAAVLGRLESVGLCVVGALVIGIAQSEMSYYVSTPGWSDAAPFILIVGVLLVRGIGRTPRTSIAARLPSVGTGIIRWQLVVPTCVVLLLLSAVITNVFWLSAITTSIGAAIVLMSFVIVTGYSGQLSLAQFAFAGLGAWIAGHFVIDKVPLPVAVILGVVLLFPIGIALGAICLRTTGINLAIATLGFALSVEYLIFDSSSLTGPNGLVVGKISLLGWNITAIDHPGRYAAVATVALFVAGIITANARRGVVGQRLLAARSNERAAASLGLRVMEAKVFAFGLGAVIAALGGVVLGLSNTTVVLADFSTLSGLLNIPAIVVGGLGWVAGSAIAGLNQTGGVIEQALASAIGTTGASYLPLVLGVLALVILRMQPDGAAAVMMEQVRPLMRRLGMRGNSQQTISATPPGTTVAKPEGSNSHRLDQPKPLEVRDLTVRFGGVVAVDSASLTVRQGEVVGLIGPNGAGKTTLVDALTGYVDIGGGTIQLGADSLNGASTTARAKLGLTRSFQSLELFDDLSVLDNLRAASDSGGLLSYLTNIVRPRLPELGSAATAAIPEFGLTDSLPLSPSELPYSARRLTAIARAVAADPAVLLLDEPCAGLDFHETSELSSLIRRLAGEWGMGVLLIEHDVGMVMQVCDRIYVMELGHIIAEGTPTEIQNDERVLRAYLGSTKGSLGKVPVGAPDEAEEGTVDA